MADTQPESITSRPQSAMIRKWIIAGLVVDMVIPLAFAAANWIIILLGLGGSGLGPPVSALIVIMVAGAAGLSLWVFVDLVIFPKDSPLDRSGWHRYLRTEFSRFLLTFFVLLLIWTSVDSNSTRQPGVMGWVDNATALGILIVACIVGTGIGLLSVLIPDGKKTRPLAPTSLSPSTRTSTSTSRQAAAFTPSAIDSASPAAKAKSAVAWIGPALKALLSVASQLVRQVGVKWSSLPAWSCGCGCGAGALLAMLVLACAGIGMTYYAVSRSLAANARPAPSTPTAVAQAMPTGTPMPTQVAQAIPTTMPMPTPDGFRLYRSQGMTIMLPNSFLGGNLTTDLDWVIENARQKGLATADLLQIANRRDAFLFVAYDLNSGVKNGGPMNSVMAARDKVSFGVTLDVYVKALQTSLLEGCSGCQVSSTEKRTIAGYEGARFERIDPAHRTHQIYYVFRGQDAFWAVICTAGENTFDTYRALYEIGILTLTIYGDGTPMPTESSTAYVPPSATPTLAATETRTPLPPSPTSTPSATPTITATKTTTPVPPSSTPSPSATPTQPSPTATRTVAVGLHCDNPNARIISPAMDETLSGTVPVTGVATVPDFVYYKVQYLPEPMRALNLWGELYQSKTPMTQPGKLTEWNTDSIPPGVYWMRLIVADRSGNYPDPCEVRVKVAH